VFSGINHSNSGVILGKRNFDWLVVRLVEEMLLSKDEVIVKADLIELYFPIEVSYSNKVSFGELDD
jgi:hypothetical protein